MLDIERFRNDLASLHEIFERLRAKHLREQVADSRRLDGAGIDFLARLLREQTIEELVLASAAHDVDCVVTLACDFLDLRNRPRVAVREAVIDAVEELAFRLGLFLLRPFAVVLDSLDHAVRREEAVIIDIDR